ncbi:ankyrin repeat [Fusarium sporotrichioides]|uniref:Ankyrin repeat n=1 Tax=Fusarium sporotrichioides TaxID=5514 RepID=A0A395RWU3_FUSSP|nr:ankyrin repeat [Fusarium sporotrichioides]
MTASMSRTVRWLFVSTLVIGSLAADDGDDFSNNLFSDLAPLLALFGERVTMQFMSQSMGWADNIILAMAPIGIIAAIVASIRVGGPPWLKAVIGRARENLAVSEVELMSSTSKEVCEVWNGQEVVRCMGLAPVVEFICLLHYTNTRQADRQTAPEIEVLNLDDAIQKGYIKDLGKYYEFILQCHTMGSLLRFYSIDGGEQDNAPPIPEGDEEQANPTPNSYPMTDFGKTPAGSKKLEKLKKICIIRDTSGDSPNIILNCHPPANRMELWLFAVFGTCLQFGVLAYSGLTTYNPALKFQKDDKPVESYAYPCTAVGTLVLILGMLLCGHVVESSTDEKKYEAVGGWKTRMVWLQQTKTVSDQVFNSYMVYAKDDRQTITTSRRSGKHGKNRSTATHTGAASVGNDDPSTFLNVIAMAGTGIALCGFVLQFVGLRGMHWSASIAQLGAVLVMVGVKAWVRRKLANSPDCEPFPSGFELDWFARSLGGIDTEPWSGQKNTSDSDDSMMSGGTNTSDNKWIVVTGGDSSLTPSERSQVPTSEPNNGSLLHAQALLDARKSLAHLAEWKGTASTEAVSLARAIECTMDALNICFPENSERFTWNLEARYFGSQKQIIRIPLSRQVGGWKVDASQIEAILSLWLSSVEEEDYMPNEDTSSDNDDGSKFQKPKSQDEWLRAKGTIEKQSLRLLGKGTPSVVRDLLWWVPKDLLSVFQIQEDQVGSLRTALQIGKHRVVGYNQQDEGSGQHPHQLQYLDPENNGFDDDGDKVENHSISEADTDDDDDVLEDGDDSSNYKDFADDSGSENEKDHGSSEDEVESLSDDGGKSSTGNVTLLGNESYQPLKALYAIDLFSSFTGAVAKAMVTAIPGQAEDIRPNSGTDDGSWNIFTLRNNHLSKMIQEIYNTGLGGLDQIYLSIITPLSRERRLPEIDAVINLALQRSRRNERLQNWKGAGDDLVWLFRLANRTFPRRGNMAAKATANLMEYQRLTRLVLRITKERDFELLDSNGVDIRRLKTLANRLEQELKAADPGLRSLVRERYRALSLNGRQVWPYDGVKVADGLFKKDQGTFSDPRDIIERTATHYVGLERYPLGVREYTQGQYDVNAQDLLGRTTLHYICLNDSGSLEAAQWLINHGAELDISARDGATPLHYAVMRGKEAKVRLLIEAGARIDTSDLSGRSPLHTAAVYGQVAVVEYLRDKAKPELRDRWGWNALHLAAIHGSDSVVKFLVNLKIDKEAKDRCGRTALHLAVLAGKESVVTFLIGEMADTKATDIWGNHMFLLAVRARRVGMVQLLIDRGFHKELKEINSKEPLAIALEYGQKDVARLLMCHGVNYNWEGSFKQNLLHYASMGPSNSTLIQELLDRGLDINSRALIHQTPLYCAVQRGRTSNVGFLLDKGANINQTFECGQTALWAAINYRKVHIVQLLLDNGATTDVSLCTIRKSQTLLSMVKELGDKKIIDLVRSRRGMSMDDWDNIP